jgi:putative RecB family exonuclease
MNASLPTVDRPLESAGVRSYISPSRLNCWLRCPLAFRFRYLEGLEPPCSPAQALGRVVHRALETWYRFRLLGAGIVVEDVLLRLPHLWEAVLDESSVGFNSTTEEHACLGQAHDLVEVYLKQTDPDEPLPLAVERTIEAPLVDPLTGEDLGIPLVGVLDLALAEPTGPIIVDFKTVARGGAPHEISHEIQLGAYAYLLRSESGCDPAALEIRQLIKTKQPRVEYHRFARRGQRHFRRLFAVIRAYLDALDSNRFVYRPSLGCNSCEYRETACVLWDGD